MEDIKKVNIVKYNGLDDNYNKVISFYENQKSAYDSSILNLQNEIKSIKTSIKLDVETEDEVQNNLILSNRLIELKTQLNTIKGYRDELIHDLNKLIEDYIYESVNIESIPEKYRDKVKSYAWERSHSYGYSEYYNVLLGLIDIFE